MMKKGKLIILKVVILLALLVLMNWVYNRFYYEKDLQKHSPIINLVRAIDFDTDLIYLGESSNDSYHEDDLDKRVISEMISDYYPNLKLQDITKPAAHAGIYSGLLTHIPEDSQIKTVIITLNLRSFGADWIHSKLEASLQKSLVLLRKYPPLINRFLLAFKAYHNPMEYERSETVKNLWKIKDLSIPNDFPYQSVFEWDRATARNGVKNAEGNYDAEKTELACHFIKSYAFRIDTIKHPRIKDFDAIISYAKKRDWNLVFNLLAENTEKGRVLVGNELTTLMNDNATLLTQYFERKGVTVINNLNEVRSKNYIDQNWTTEHYTEEGRKSIAESVGQGLKRYHQNDFKKLEIKKINLTRYFNDCEKNKSWEQRQSISDTYSFSGRYSSKIDKNQPYSITFNTLLNRIPKDSCNVIEIDFVWYTEDVSPESKLVIELIPGKDSEIKPLWLGLNFEGLTSSNEEKNWNRTLFNYDLPATKDSFRRVKIYALNNKDLPVYIDDIKIEFK